MVNGAGGPRNSGTGRTRVFDGTVHGGTGTWDNFTTNFTNAGVTANQSWQNGIAIFSATPGTVTLGDNILFQGMQFTISGYTVAGAGAFTLQPTGTAIITTDPGVTATIAAPITGPGGLNKAGLGLLKLTGVNTYSGGTTISGGVLKGGQRLKLGRRERRAHLERRGIVGWQWVLQRQGNWRHQQRAALWPQLRAGPPAFREHDGQRELDHRGSDE